LKAKKRTLLGRKVKKLRKEGLIPANVYGKKVKSEAIEVEEKEFTEVFTKAGETAIVNLVLDGKDHPVLIHLVQHDPVTRFPLHIDFFQVDLKEKVTAKVPLVIVGESPAVKDKIGVLLHILSEVEIEALPADLLEKIEVDVSSLSAVDQLIKVGELKVSDKVKILTDANLDVVKIAPLISKEAEKLAKEEAEKAAAAAAAAVATTPTTEPAQTPTAASSKETPTQQPQPAPTKE